MMGGGHRGSRMVLGCEGVTGLNEQVVEFTVLREQMPHNGWVGTVDCGHGIACSVAAAAAKKGSDGRPAEPPQHHLRATIFAT